eukprot:174972-Rhodomonas_salina.1
MSWSSAPGRAVRYRSVPDIAYRARRQIAELTGPNCQIWTHVMRCQHRTAHSTRVCTYTAQYRTSPSEWVGPQRRTGHCVASG